MQSILVFRIGLLQLSASTYKATSLTTANLVNHLERFWLTFVQFGNIRKAFLLSLKRKIIANILRFLGRRESKLVLKILKNCQSCFTMVSHQNFFNKNILIALSNKRFRLALFMNLRRNEQKKKTKMQGHLHLHRGWLHWNDNGLL